MFCGNCGAKNEEGAAFCHQCGAALTPAAPQASGAPTNTPAGVPTGSAPVMGAGAGAVAAKKPGMSNALKGIIAVAVAAVVVILLLVFVVFGGRSYEDTVEDFFDACLDGDVNAIVELLPSDMIDTVLDDPDYGYNGDRAAMISDLEDEMGISYLSDMMNSDIDIDYEVLRATDRTQDDIDYLQEQYNEFNVDIDDAKLVQVSLTVEYGDMSDSTEMEVPVIKVGRSWYLDVSGF